MYPEELNDYNWDLDFDFVLACANCDKEILSTDPEVTYDSHVFQWTCTECDYLNDYELPDCDPDFEYEWARDMD